MSLLKKTESKSFEIHGKELRCLICGHDEFWRREGQLNTAAASLFQLDWANKSAVCIVCDRCGYIHWFLPK